MILKNIAITKLITATVLILFGLLNLTIVPAAGQKNLLQDETIYKPGFSAEDRLKVKEVAETELPDVSNLESAPPANDNFANASNFIGNTSGGTLATNVDATGETGEPNHCAGRGGTLNFHNSVWYSFTAIETKVITISTNSGGANPISDTVLSAYTGANINTLTPIAENDDYPGMGFFSQITFGIIAGQTYHVAVDGFNSATGTFALNYNTANVAANDNFANAVTLSGTISPFIGITSSNLNSTGEMGEPSHVGGGAVNSIWYSWTAPANLSMTFTTAGSSFDTTLSVYTGSAVNNLSLVANDDDDGPGNSSRVTFIATAGTTYRIAIEGFINFTGNTLLNWNINRAESSKRFDFDGDNKSEISIFRPSVGEWWYRRSFNNQVTAAQFGGATHKITPGDWTGDGKTDLAFWRPATGFWFVLRSDNNSFFSFPFGTDGDIPVPADYDGDDIMDAAVFRPSNATWYINQSGGGVIIQQFGNSTDKPVVADYDGDGEADIAIYRPSASEWWINRSSGGVFATQFGNSSDKPVQGDYTGDGKADIAFWRPASGEWFVLRSEDSSFFSAPFGSNGDIPSPGDYDGDGKVDLTVFRPSNATWFINFSSGEGILITGFGLNGDTPVPSAFVP